MSNGCINCLVCYFVAINFFNWFNVLLFFAWFLTIRFDLCTFFFIFCTYHTGVLFDASDMLCVCVCSYLLILSYIIHLPACSCCLITHMLHQVVFPKPSRRLYLSVGLFTHPLTPLITACMTSNKHVHWYNEHNLIYTNAYFPSQWLRQVLIAF